MTRERIRNEVAEGSWDLFNQLLDSTPRGNFGNIGKHKREENVVGFPMGWVVDFYPLGNSFLIHWWGSKIVGRPIEIGIILMVQCCQL